MSAEAFFKRPIQGLRHIEEKNVLSRKHIKKSYKVKMYCTSYDKICGVRLQVGLKG